jgi:glutathione peroxidase
MSTSPVVKTVGAPTTLFDFNVRALDGSIVSLSEYRDKKVILVVNTSSEAWSADTYWKELQETYDRYKDKNFEILAFPSGQLQNGEKIVDAEMPAWLRLKGITFPVFARVDVNGASADPMFDWIKSSAHGFITDSIKLNFTKFLVVDGIPMKRYAPDEPVGAEIVKMLQRAETKESSEGRTEGGAAGSSLSEKSTEPRERVRESDLDREGDRELQRQRELEREREQRKGAMAGESQLSSDPSLPTYSSTNRPT